jgi:predicted ester cyclase
MQNPFLSERVLSIMVVVMIGVAVLSDRPREAVADPNKGGAMSNDTNATTIRRFYDECLNGGRLDLLPEVVSADVVSHTFDGGEQKGLAAFEKSIRSTQAMFPNPHFTLEDIVSHGDEAAVRWSMATTHSATVAGMPPTGKRLTQRAIGIYRIEGGKIAEVWLEVDRLGMLQQLGVTIPGLPGAPAVRAAQQ